MQKGYETNGISRIPSINFSKVGMELLNINELTRLAASTPHDDGHAGLLLAFSERYALSRSLSPAMIAEYQAQLPDKKLLQAKLHEFYLLKLPHHHSAAPSFPTD